MNNIAIDYDGRVTAWNTPLTSPRASQPPRKPLSEEWGLFSVLPPEVKRAFLISSLGSSHVTNSEDFSEKAPRARRGTKGITSYGRSLIRMGCQKLEDDYGVNHLSFLTCTLPEAALAACTPVTWAEVVHRFLKSLRARLERANLSPEIVGCIEVQGSRLLQSEGLPPLHLHLLFQGRQRGKSWAFRPSQLQASWARACQSVWGDIQGFQSSCRVERLRSSGVSYMSKYMSKGSDVLSLCKPELLPSAWYTISTKLKAFVKNARFKLSGQAAHDLYEYLYSGDQMKWCRSVMSEYTETGTCYLLAWIGQLRNRDTYWSIVDDLRPVLYALAKENLTGML